MEWWRKLHNEERHIIMVDESSGRECDGREMRYECARAIRELHREFYS